MTVREDVPTSNLHPSSQRLSWGATSGYKANSSSLRIVTTSAKICTTHKVGSTDWNSHNELYLTKKVAYGQHMSFIGQLWYQALQFGHNSLTFQITTSAEFKLSMGRRERGGEGVCRSLTAFGWMMFIVPVIARKIKQTNGQYLRFFGFIDNVLG